MYLSRVQVSEDGIKSLVRLASGDMRKALNILQVSGKVSLSLWRSGLLITVFSAYFIVYDEAINFTMQPPQWKSQMVETWLSKIECKQ